MAEIHALSYCVPGRGNSCTSASNLFPNDQTLWKKHCLGLILKPNQYVGDSVSTLLPPLVALL